MRLLPRGEHRRHRQDLSAYIDGRLETRRRQALERHLAQCTSCQEGLETLRRVVALLRRVPQAPVPRSFTLTSTPAPRPSWTVSLATPLRYATAVAGLLFLVVVVGDLVAQQPSAPAAEVPQVQDIPGARSLEGTADAGAAAGAPASQEKQVIPEATAAPQSLPLVKIEKAPETRAEAAQEQGPPGGFTVQNVFRWGEIALGAILAVLVALMAVQWWLRRANQPG